MSVQAAEQFSDDSVVLQAYNHYFPVQVDERKNLSMQNSAEALSDDRYVTGGSRAVISAVSHENNAPPTYVLKWSNGDLSASYDPVVVEYIGTTCSPIFLDHNIPVFTELKDRLTNTLFCAHPCY